MQVGVGECVVVNVLVGGVCANMRVLHMEATCCATGPVHLVYGDRDLSRGAEHTG